MSTAAPYVPRSGSFAEKAIEYLRLHGGDATTAVLAEHGDISPSFVAGMLAWPVKQGVVRVEKRDGLNHWSLGDGKPLPKPVEADGEGEEEPDPDPVQRTVPAANAVTHPGQVRRDKATVLGIPLPPQAPEPEEVQVLTEQLPTRPARVFGCGIFSDGRLVLELASGDDVVLQRDETRALVTFLDRALDEELTA